MTITLRTTTATTNGDLTITNKGSKLTIQEMDQNLIDLYNARVRIKNSNMYTQTSFNATSSGTQNTAFGYRGLLSNTTGYNNTAVGTDTLRDNTTGYNNTAISTNSLLLNTTGSLNTVVGVNSLYSNTTGSYNTAVGVSSLQANSTGRYNTAIGNEALYYNTTSEYNVAVGYKSLYNNTTGTQNTAIGVAALQANSTGSGNTAIGNSALEFNLSGINNTAIGNIALRYTIPGVENTNYSNCVGLGYDARVTGSNQVQLGNSLTTTYVYGALGDRSDIRDKADIRDTTLGLDFIEKVRPVDFKWNYRDDYYIDTAVEEEYTETKQINNPDFNPQLEESESNQRLITITETKTRTIPTREAITNDGSKTRNRYHHGVIAQEVKEVIDELGIDFGGFQDHKVSGGNDILTIGYTEFIAPMIKAIQELSEQNKALTERIQVLESM